MSEQISNLTPVPDIFHDYEDGSTLIGSIEDQSSASKDGSVKGESLPIDFSASEYVRLNPDVGAAGVDPAVHYVYEGIREGRRYRSTAS